MDSRSSYAVPFYSPAFANARHWTVALLFGSLFRAMGGIDPEFDHIVDDTAPQGFRHDPDKLSRSVMKMVYHLQPSALGPYDMKDHQMK